MCDRLRQVKALTLVLHYSSRIFRAHKTHCFENVRNPLRRRPGVQPIGIVSPAGKPFCVPIDESLNEPALLVPLIELLIVTFRLKSRAVTMRTDIIPAERRSYIAHDSIAVTQLAFHRSVRSLDR